jgi:methionine aminotransferase
MVVILYFILKLQPLQVDSKLPSVGTTIFSLMSELATQHNAINLGQGFPDYTMSPALIDLVTKAMKDGYNQYAPMPGYMPLREAIAEKIFSLYHTQINPATEVTITPGGTYAIYSALTTILHPGDEVIIFEPAYDSYVPNIEINGAKVIRINLVYPHYHINWQAVENAFTSKTKAIIINSPHNPTGSIISESDIHALRALANKHSFYIISDEVYEHLVYDGQMHLSLLRYPDLLSRSFVCASFGKTYHCTGWKMGYCVAPAHLSAALRTVHQFNCFSCFTPAQVALASFIQKRDDYLSLANHMQEKRDYFVALMQATKFSLHPSNGSYFICGTYQQISEESDMDFAIRLIKEVGVATIPVSAFYQNKKDDKILRFCFAKKKETLEAAVNRLMKVR